MKYGLIVYKGTGNIGDDVQSYAMERFLPRVDYLIDREHIDSFYTETGETVAAVCGGWYLHRALNWPPSPFLNPVLPISIHFRRSKFAMDDYGGEWFKKFSPIGCRDENTLKRFKRSGIPAYLSGCCTLTLEPFKNAPSHNKIILTDVPEPVVEFVKAHTKKEIVIFSHHSGRFKSIIEFAEAEDKTKMTFGSAFEEVTQFKHMTWLQRRTLVEELLKCYQGASLVITSRLHAALPCLALGTPILLVTDKQSDIRFSTFIPYLNNTTPKDLLDKKYVFDFDEPKANPGGHEKFIGTIKKTCTDFIDSCENSTETSVIDVETWLDGYNRNQRLKRIIKSLEPKKHCLRIF